MCKYYYEKTLELSKGPFGINESTLHKCNQTILEPNGEISAIIDCSFYESFSDCKYYEPFDEEK